MTFIPNAEGIQRTVAKFGSLKQNIAKLWGDPAGPHEQHRLVSTNSTENGNAVIEYARTLGWQPTSIAMAQVGMIILFERIK